MKDRVDSLTSIGARRCESAKKDEVNVAHLQGSLEVGKDGLGWIASALGTG